MDEVKVSGLKELENHLQEVIAFPDTTLDAKLFDDVELQLNGRLRRFSTHSGICKMCEKYLHLNAFLMAPLKPARASANVIQRPISHH
jgi:hypothetical protein